MSDIKFMDTVGDNLVRVTTEAILLKRKEDELLEELNDVSLYQDYSATRTRRLAKEKEVEEKQEEYRQMAVKAMLETGRYSFALGYFKEHDMIEYEEVNAMRWAVEHSFITLLKLDKVAFERTVRNAPWLVPMETAQVVKELKLTFDRKEINRLVEPWISEPDDE